MLGHRHKAVALLIEGFNDLGEVGQGTREPVYLIYDDGIDPLGRDVFEQSFQRWTLYRATREASVIVKRPNKLPTLMPLANDIGFACLALGV